MTILDRLRHALGRQPTIGEGVALARLAGEQRGAWVLCQRLRMCRKPRNEDDRDSVDIGGEQDAAGEGKTGLGIENGDGRVPCGAQQHAGKLAGFIVGFAYGRGLIFHIRYVAKRIENIKRPACGDGG
ncbi:UNVERIFIED_ORG: hypothetical protein GGE64_002038 [Rhizobium etli]